jgi:hypothetical protein
MGVLPFDCEFLSTASFSSARSLPPQNSRPAVPLVMLNGPFSGGPGRFCVRSVRGSRDVGIRRPRESTYLSGPGLKRLRDVVEQIGQKAGRPVGQQDGRRRGRFCCVALMPEPRSWIW